MTTTRAEAVAASGSRDTCAACQASQPVASMEPVPSRPFLLRCADAEACRKRYAAPRLAVPAAVEAAAPARDGPARELPAGTERTRHMPGLAGGLTACRHTWAEPGLIALAETLAGVNCQRCRKSRAYRDRTGGGRG